MRTQFTYSLALFAISMVSLGLAQQVTGTGTTDYVPIWTSSMTLGNSAIYQSGSNIGIGTTTPGSSLDVAGNVNIGGASSYRIGQSPVVSISGTGNLFLGAAAG